MRSLEKGTARVSYDWQTLWFILVGVLFSGYAILDGFDLGVGALHLFVKKDKERRVFLNAIGPIWDGNEVWLVTGGGALFAAFPEVYATVFSGFYLAFMLLLVALDLPGGGHRVPEQTDHDMVAEFLGRQFQREQHRLQPFGGRGHGQHRLGHSPGGRPRVRRGIFLGLLKPYALLVGVTTLALFMMHGSIYIVLKTEGRSRRGSRNG